MARIMGWVGFCWLLGSSAVADPGSGGFDAPPPPPAYGSAPVAAPAPVMTPEAAAASRYQSCFQRMVDAGVNDNAFMKKCLGIAVRSPPQPVVAPVVVNRRPRGSEALTKVEITTFVQQNLGGLTDCYDNLLTLSRDFGLAPGGLLGAMVEIQPNGQTQVLGIDPQSLPDLSLLNCFRSRLRAWVYPRRRDAERSRFYVSFVLLPKSAVKGQVTLARGFPQLLANPASESRPRAK